MFLADLCRNKSVDTRFVTSEDFMTTNTLQPTSWLAKRLGLSVSCIERLRARGEGELPPHITIGLHTIRYDPVVVETWLAEQQHGRLPSPAPAVPTTNQATRKSLFGKRVIAGPASA
jgi:predicted DNA-binding transcriptional regulator AlpA